MAGSEVVVLDGGFATQLARRVTQPVDGTPLWSASFLASDPRACVDTHLDFLRAGSAAISTNTYQASVEGFMKHLSISEEESLQLMRTAVGLAREACAKHLNETSRAAGSAAPLVVGSVGPYGAALNDGSEYTGHYVESVSKARLMEWHRPRIQALVSAGVDLLALETIPAQAEGEALAELLTAFPQQKAWLTFSCKDEFHTSHGEKFAEAVHSCIQINPKQLVAIGTNCVNPKYVKSLLEGVRKVNTMRDIPLVVYPNSGEIYNAECGRWSQGLECRPLETYVSEWLNLGVRYIGGCCRTYPQDITKIAEEAAKWRLSQA